jgi:multidrug resistance efflux pump
MSDEDSTKFVYVGIPGLVADGDPIGDSISDAVVEALEVDPLDVQVVEGRGKFYVFIKSLPFTFTTANQTVARAAELSQTYDRTVSRLTKSVRRADKAQADLHALRKEVAALAREKEELELELAQAQAARDEQAELAKNVEADLQTLITSLTPA